MADNKTPAKAGSSKAAPTTWRFVGAYPCIYCNYRQVSGWVEPGQVVEWPDGPPDGNWEPVEPVEPSPAPKKAAPPASAPETKE